MTDVIEERLRHAALASPAVPPPLGALRRRAARRRASAVVAAAAAVAVVAVGITSLPSVTRTSGEVARTVEQGGFRLEVRVEDTDLELGDTLRVRFTATNTTDQVLRYADALCGLGASASLEIGLGPTGRSWTGVAARFRDLAAPDPQVEPTGVFGGDRTCTDGSVEQGELAPGASYSGTASTEVTLPGGRADGTGSVLLRVINTTDSSTFAEAAVTVPLRITGDSGRTGRYEAVDAALSDPAFAAFLEDNPDEQRWEIPAAALVDGRWRVGLLPTRGPGLVTGSVVVDPKTGKVVERDLP